MSNLPVSLIGKVVGNYEIQCELGRGGMGVVYRAHEQSLQRMVALKVLPESLARDPGFVRRFIREARAAAQLSHPNIVHVYAVGEHNGTYFIAMEYITGKTLAEHICERGRFTPRDALHVVAEVADALTEAHDRDIIHRDIKPQNIMVDLAGRVKVMDFGLARQTVGRSNLTQTGAMMGTPAYMAPEQVRGPEVDGRVDIYSLGIAFFEMLTGHPPFQADTPVALMYQVMQEPCPPLTDPRLEIPEPVARVVAKMTAKRREDRYPSAQALLGEVRALLGNTPGAIARPTPIPATAAGSGGGGGPAFETPPIPPVPAPSPGIPKRKNFVGRALVVVLALACLIGAGYVAWYRLERQLPAALVQAQASYTAERYVDAYRVLSGYLSDHEPRWINRSDSRVAGWLRAYIPKRLIGTTYAEAPYLMGLLGLRCRSEIAHGLAGDGGAGAADIENNTRYEILFERAALLDPAYRSKIAGALDTAIQERLDAGSASNAVQRLAKTCGQEVAAKAFARAVEAITAFANEQLELTHQLDEIVALLGRFDSERANAAARRLESAKTKDEDLQYVQVQAMRNVAPDLALALNSLTAEDMRGSSAPRGRLPGVTLFVPLFNQQSDAASVRDLYQSLLRAYLLLAENTGPTRETGGPNDRAACEAAWSELAGVASEHPQEYLRFLIAEIPLHPNLALYLLDLTPDPVSAEARTVRNTEDPSSARPATCLSERAAQGIGQAVAEMFVKAALAHSALTSTQPYDPFCGGIWPGVNMQAVGEKLAQRMPSLLQQDDALFAAAWSYIQIREANPLSPLAQYGPEIYLAQFPQGRHAGLINQCLGKGVSPEDRKTLEEVEAWLEQAHQEAGRFELESAERHCRRVMQLTNEKPGMSPFYREASELSRWLDLVSDPARRFVVEGLMTTQKSFLVQIHDNANDVTESIARGQSISGYVLVSIAQERREATLSKDGKTFLIPFAQK